MPVRSKQLLENLDQYIPIMPQNYFGDEPPGSGPGPTPQENPQDDFVPLHATRRRKKLRKNDDQKLLDFVMQFIKMRSTDHAPSPQA